MQNYYSCVQDYLSGAKTVTQWHNGATAHDPHQSWSSIRLYLKVKIDGSFSASGCGFMLTVDTPPMFESREYWQFFQDFDHLFVVIFNLAGCLIMHFLIMLWQTQKTFNIWPYRDFKMTSNPDVMKVSLVWFFCMITHSIWISYEEFHSS